MCGIVGYIGEQDAASILLKGLGELEYRGYDSAGIAVLDGGDLRSFKAVGRLERLVDKVGGYRSSGLATGIGHTRWATHGAPTEINAHPHGINGCRVVHNGIIENYRELRQSLPVPTLSQTDSEVIVHLFEKYLGIMENRQGERSLRNLALQAFRATLDELRGAYAILLLSAMVPGALLFARKGSPLQLGFSSAGCHFASSDVAMLGLCDQVIDLADGHWGMAWADKVELFDASGAVVNPPRRALAATSTAARKEGFRYFMEKEIFEQPSIVEAVLMGRLNDPGTTGTRGASEVDFEELSEDWLRGFASVTLCACGTSYHAALVGSYLLERIARVPVRVEIASEFRYRDPVLEPDSLLIAISQSGETADTLEAMRLGAARGLASLVLCNVDNSTAAREATRTIRLRAGIEKGVASTKAFTAQVLTLWLLAVYWAQAKGLDNAPARQRETDAMRELAAAMKLEPGIHERVKRLSKRYLHGHGFFFIGRDIFYPLALEGALKLKDISYLHAEGYPAGEMKHGPIALADPRLFTIALMPASTLCEKVKSNVEELAARESTIIAIATEPVDLADDMLWIRPHAHPMLEFFEMLVVVQLLAMEIAIRLGNDVDMPRNLAKSVTVE